jgi:hypothetical protein
MSRKGEVFARARENFGHDWMTCATVTSGAVGQFAGVEMETLSV